MQRPGKHDPMEMIKTWRELQTVEHSESELTYNNFPGL